MNYRTKRIGYIIILTTLLINVSCLNQYFIEGKSELVSIADTMLNDSSIFVGNVNQIDGYPRYPYDLWIENTLYKTSIDSTGYYSLKIEPGVYSIKCQQRSNEWEQLIEIRNNVQIERNKKIQINFYIGYTIE